MESYYRTLYTKKPSTVPDLDTYITNLKAHLGQPGRIRALRGQINGSKKPCEERLPQLKQNRTPVLVLMGSKDPDFPSPEKEAQLIISRIGETSR